MAFFAKSDQLMKKHGIKIVGSWSALPGMHLDVVVFEAPSMEALMKFSMEPEVMSLMVHNTSELYPVMTTEEEMKLFR